MLKPKFLEPTTCYFCGDDIHNYELVELFDGRQVKSCYECYSTVQIAITIYYCKIADIEISWEDEHGKE